jgi:Domain of unknown function (DUF1707)/Domain of unknown function (DUF4190)
MAVGHYAWANNGRGQMRAADVDRDRAVSFLTTAFTEGRLTKDEYDERVETALKARTYADLDLVVTDLPGARGVPVVRPRGTNGLAIASLACGISQFMLGPLPTIPAIVLGHMARHQIKRTGEDGAGLALAGLMLGWAAVIFGIIAIAGIAAVATHSFGYTGVGHVVHARPGGGVPQPPLPAQPPSGG